MKDYKVSFNWLRNTMYKLERFGERAYAAWMILTGQWVPAPDTDKIKTILQEAANDQQKLLDFIATIPNEGGMTDLQCFVKYTGMKEANGDIKN